MRHHFDGFDSAVDLYEIDTVVIDQIDIRGFAVVINTKGGNKSRRTFVAANPLNAAEMLTLSNNALACRDLYEKKITHK